MKAKTSKLAMSVLALSLAQAASASESPTHKEADNNSTYWGVGIGSVLSLASLSVVDQIRTEQ